MGGKSGTTTQSVSIPPEVLARYNSVNAQAQQVAATPFQPYTGQFVANLTPTQQAGIAATTQGAQAAQPYFSAATTQLQNAQQSALPGISAAYQNVGGAQDIGTAYAQQATQGLGGALQYAAPYQAGATQAAMMGAQGVNPQALNVGAYMSPYTQAVADTTFQALRQQQQQEMAGQTANAIRSGAFGGDRAGLVAANLARQQQLGTAQTMAPIYQQGFSQALGAAQQQQGVQLSAEQANRAALQNLSQQLQGIGQTGYGQQMGVAQQLAGLGQQQFGQGMGAAQQLAGLAQQGYGMGAQTAQQLSALGAGAQEAALQGAQAQLGAGTLEQQTQQADLTARYQQFLQERGYPFQVAQFLANIAMGTGSLSGSTTTTTQPMPFFSDRRVKDDVKEIGKTHDGQPIYSFKYKGDDATRIGLMAQDVEKKHPEAVYDMGGVKGVDYKQATEAAERPERYSGGLVPASMGGAVYEPGAYSRGGYAPGGLVDPNDIQALIAMQQEALGPFGESGLYGGSAGAPPYLSERGIVPPARLHVAKLMTAGPAPALPESGIQQATGVFDEAMKMRDRYRRARDAFDTDDTPQKKMDENRVGQSGTDRRGLAGPDIMPDKKPDEEKSLLGSLASIFGYAEGGLVPREHYAVGGSKDPSLPYEEDDKSPYKYFPTEILETEKPELAKPSQAPTPTSQSGIGLGTLLGLFFNQGGVVPRGHLQTGGVYDPTMGRIVESSELTPERIAELNKEDVYSREMQPAVAPRFRTFERIAKQEGATGIKPIELYRSPERSAFLDLTMPEGAPRAKPYSSGHSYGLAGDYSGITDENLPAVRAAAKATGLTLGEDFSNPDRPHVQYSKGSFGGLSPKFGTQLDLPPGSKDANFSGVVPPELQEAAYAKARQFVGSRGVDPDSERGQSMTSSLMDYLRKNQEWLVPIGAGIRGMVQSRSPFLGAAVLEGLGSGMEAVGASQKQMADIALTRAQAMRESLGLIGQRYKRLPDGTFFDTIENKKVSLEERNAEMRRLGLPVGMEPNIVGQAQAVLEKSGLPVDIVPTAPTSKQEAPAAPTEAPAGAKVEPKKPAMAGTERPMSPEYPDIPIVENRVNAQTNAIYERAKQDPAAQEWLRQVENYRRDAEAAQERAKALYGIDDAQAQQFQQEATNLRNNMSQAQAQLLATLDRIAGPEIKQLEGQIAVQQATDKQILGDRQNAINLARKTEYRLEEMRKNFQKLPEEGWLSTGPYGEQRFAIAKNLNGILNIFGANPAFDEQAIARGESIQKDTRRLGEDLARSLGGGPAAAVVQGSIEATPSIQNTEMGWRLLLSSLEQANDMQKKEADFMLRYYRVNNTLEGAQEAFNEAYPVEQFVNEAIAGIANPQIAQSFVEYVGKTKTPAKIQDAKNQIDKKYGKGTADAILKSKKFGGAGVANGQQ